jgi:hypothetical protein
MKSADLVFLVVTVHIANQDWEFVSEPMSRLWADILLKEFIIAREPFKVVKAKLVKSTGEEV